MPLTPRVIEMAATDVLQSLDDQTLAKMVKFNIRENVCSDFDVSIKERPAAFTWDIEDDYLKVG